jgi:uncharacterized RDD family membrane protein YckC
MSSSGWQHPGAPGPEPAGRPGVPAGTGHGAAPGFGVPVAYPTTGAARRQPARPDPDLDPPGSYQGVALASWGRRVAATLLDTLIGLFLSLPGAVVLLLGADQAGGTGGAVFLVLGVVLSLLGAGLGVRNQFAVQGRTGQTWGKQALGIRLLRKADGRPPGIGLVVVRWFAHLLDGAVCYLGYLWPLWDPLRQTFADKLVGSLVVHER